MSLMIIGKLKKIAQQNVNLYLAIEVNKAYLVLDSKMLGRRSKMTNLTFVPFIYKL